MGRLNIIRESTDLAREKRLVVELTLDPCHEQLNILRRGHFQRSLDILPISPEILKLLPCAHDRAGVLGAKLSQRSIQNRDLVIELNGVDGEPFVEILA